MNLREPTALSQHRSAIAVFPKLLVFLPIMSCAMAFRARKNWKTATSSILTLPSFSTAGYGDTSRMFFVGDQISLKARRLVEITYEALLRGIAVVKPGATFGDIGYAIQSFAEEARFSVVRDFCGHGLGRIFHTSPSVLHYGEKGEGEVIQQGMFFTIEPMINAGRFDVKVLKDGWTAVTKDKSLSAQFEHSIGVTETGAEIFTLSPQGYKAPPYILNSAA